jgi:NAD(P)-dependent dehydrogenase (short-subunit alcohol dehydrogenase family)
MPRIAIVTGGGSGIGAAVSTALVQRGDSVVVADIDADAAERVAKQLTDRGPGTASPAVVDVRDADAVANLVDETADVNGRLDVIFNNAGIGVGGDVNELTIAHWDRVIDVNLRGVVHGVQAAYPLMVRQGHGHIVNTASLAGLIPSPYLAPYAATKHAVVGLSLSLRAEAKATGVKVTVVCPGFVDTPILDKGGPDDLPKSAFADRTREVASEMPGGLYDPNALAGDILRGIDRNKAIVIAPRNARALWGMTRVSPSLFTTLAAWQAQRGRKRWGLQ